MRATRVSEFGPPDVLELVEIDDPTPGAGEVLVDIRATHVLWVDTAIRSGAGRDWFPLRPPYVPGTGVAGTVAAVGPDLPASWPGRRVVAHTGLSGGYADRVVVPVEQVVPVPERVSLEAAAALVHDATTALALFDALRVGPDDTVLVVGASGGLGLVSVQLARRRARDVLALARDQAKIARIRDATGVRVVDTERPDWLAEARASLPRGADVVLDNVGGPLGAAAVELLADGGHYVARDPRRLVHRHRRGRSGPSRDHPARHRRRPVRHAAPDGADRRGPGRRGPGRAHPRDRPNLPAGQGGRRARRRRGADRVRIDAARRVSGP